MYLIKRVDFDSLENRLSDAICETIVGVIDCDEDTVLKWIDEHNQTPDKHYKGWDGVIYPYYTKTKVELIESPQDTKENKIIDKMTIKDLIGLAETEGYSMNTIIYPLGADVKYVKFSKDIDGNECVVLDEYPIDDK